MTHILHANTTTEPIGGFGLGWVWSERNLAKSSGVSGWKREGDSHDIHVWDGNPIGYPASFESGHVQMKTRYVTYDK